MSEIVKPVEEIKGTLAKMKDQFSMVLPKQIPSDRFIRVAQTALMNKPDLATLNRQSLYVAFTQAAQDGLMPDNREAAIVPFKGMAKYMPMVAGICKKARNTGEISSIDAQVVYEKDSYEAWVDEKGPHFKHVKARGDRGNPLLTYAYAVGKDGGCYFEEIDEIQMDAIRKMSKANDSPWNGPFKDEMRRKSALRRLAKYRLPSSSDLDHVFKHDDEIYDDPDDAKITPEETPTTPTRLSKIIMAEQVDPVVTEDLDPIGEAPAMSAQEAVKMAREVMTPAKPTVSGVISDIKAKSGTGKNGQYTRIAVQINGQWYGTFDKKLGEQMQSAIDSQSPVTATYKERTFDGKTFLDLESITVNASHEQEIPI